MEERNKLLYGIGAALAVIGIITGIIIYFGVRGSMDDIKETDFEWKSPSLVFTDGTEMTGGAVTEGIRSFKGYAVRFTVKTLDGVSADYNYDGSKELPTYDNGLPTNEPGYINPSGRFTVKDIADKDGRVTHVVITQN
jgi:hypothetical protein